MLQKNCHLIDESQNLSRGWFREYLQDGVFLMTVNMFTT
jgi:hypothetical protein